MNVLVAYASRHGATRGIAERIAETLERRGLDTVLLPAGEVRDLRPFDAFVIGSAAYQHHWLPPATDLVRRNAALLATRPTWLFSSGPLGTATAKPGTDPLKGSIPKEFGELGPRVRARDLRVFHGAYDPDAPAATVADRFMGGFMKLFPQIRSEIPSGDFREWPVIEAWADSIATALLGGRVPTPA